MTGLESIALAVAHLEEQKSRGEDETMHNNTVVAEENSASVHLGEQTSILPGRCGFTTQPRLVSLDVSTLHQLNNFTSSDQVQQGFNEYIMPPTTPTTTEVPTSPVAAAEISLSSLERQLGLDKEPSKLIPPIPDSSEVITRVLENDVLCGRGGETNHHSGNIQYRNFVKVCQPAYISAKRRDKPRIAEKIVQSVRKLGGRFLKKDPESNTWRDVGNTKAREKTSQALREGAPELRNPKDAIPTKKQSKMIDRRNSVPKIVETNIMGEVYYANTEAASSAKTSQKKRRTSLNDLAQLATMTPVASYNSEEIVSPVSSATRISMEDDVSSHHSGQSNLDSKSSRGPRIKLLKRRLECADDSSF